MHKLKWKAIFGCSVILILFVYVLYTNGNATRPVVGNCLDKSERDKLKRAVFCYKGITLLYDEKTNTIEKIGLEKSIKYLPKISPDGKKLAYTKYPNEEENYALRVSIYDLNKKTYKHIDLDSSVANAVLDIQWIDNNRMGIETHINPSNSMYQIIDYQTGKVEKDYAGALFTVLPNESIIYRDYYVHGGKEHSDTLLIDDKKIYETDHIKNDIRYPQFSKDCTKIAFMETNEYSCEKWLVTGDINIDKKVMSNVKKIKLPDVTQGYLQFDNSNNVCFVSDDKTIRVDFSNSTFIESKTIVDQEIEKEKEVKMKKIKDATAEFFNIKDIDGTDITDIHWFE